jgi:hypothetical protein
MIIKKKILLPLALTFAVGISYLAYYSFLKMEFSRITRELRKHGYPASPEELEKWYPSPPPGQNAADFYLKAACNYNRNPENVDERFLIIHGGSVEMPSPEIPLPEEIMRNTESYLQANRESLELLHKAAEFKHCRYPVEVKDPDRRLAYLSNLRQGTRLLSTEALLAAEKGDSEKALNAILSSVSLSLSLEKEPTIDSVVVMMAAEHITLGNIERILHRCNFNADQLKQLSGKLKAFDEMKTLERAFSGEITYIFSGHSLEEFLEYVDYNYMYVRKNAVLKKSVEFMSDFFLLWMMNELASVEFVSELVDICKGIPESSLSKTGAIRDRISNLPSRLFAAKLYLPLLLPKINLKAMTIAEARVARVCLAIVSFRLENGRMPENPAELVPAHIDSILLDPMDGKPLRYKKAEKGVLVYSIGADSVDNGGNPGKNNGVSIGEDIVCRISTGMPADVR